MTAELGAADALVILTRIKAYHSPQADDDATCEAWADALNYARVTNVRDAVAAVVRHYTTPGANPWITPGDVVGHYKAIRWDRLKDYMDDGRLTPDVPGDAHGSIHAKTAQARARAIEDGMPVEQAIATIPPVAAIEAPR